MEKSTMENLLKKALSSAMSSGYQLDQDALTFLQNFAKAQDPVKLIERTIKRSGLKNSFITREFLEETTKAFPPKEIVALKTSSKFIKGVFRPYSQEVESDIEIVDEPTDKICSTGKISDFLTYFNNRFTRIERLLKQRRDSRDAIPICDALKEQINSEIKTIGLVTEKRNHRDLTFIKIEDCTSTATVLVPPSVDIKVLENARQILLDEVVCIQGKRGRNELLIAKDIIYPDIPERRVRGSYESVYAVLISDIHIGSINFLKDCFSRFISWLRGQTGNERQKRLAEGVKYIVIAGDLINSVGVYPGQEEELAINDIYEQYRVASKFMEQIPEYIDIIIIPGNHDSTRQALPQPAIPKKYAESLYKNRKVLMLGNPARVRLHDVDFLLYHGRSIDDVVGGLPNITYQNLTQTVSKAMIHMLKARHLAPTYGMRTPIAPEPWDSMVIDKPPDVFHAGHVHVVGYEQYRGTLVLNSGAWQSQTDFQKRMRIIPTPGIAPIIDLKTLKVTPIDFSICF